VPCTCRSPSASRDRRRPEARCPASGLYTQFLHTRQRQLSLLPSVGHHSSFRKCNPAFSTRYCVPLPRFQHPHKCTYRKHEIISSYSMLVQNVRTPECSIKVRGGFRHVKHVWSNKARTKIDSWPNKACTKIDSPQARDCRTAAPKLVSDYITDMASTGQTDTEPE